MLKSLLSWGGGSQKKSTQDQSDEIRPIVVDLSKLNPLEDEEKEKAKDEAEIDKLETYYYKQASEEQLVQLLFEKMPQELQTEQYNTRMAELEKILKSLSKKLTKVATDNYENFCTTMMTVQDISFNLDNQAKRTSESRVQLLRNKKDFSEKILEIAGRRKLQQKKIVALDIL